MPAYSPLILKTSQLRRFCNSRNRRITPEFLRLCDRYMQKKLTQACNVHNGGKSTLDATVAGFVGITE